MATVAPLIVITGPTASGKTSLALELATKWGGEIICADSRTIYKGMDIGTAKPTKSEQKTVRHWLLDVVEPGQRFTAADFQELARAAVADIRSRGKIPFLVGGTGLYVDAVVLNFLFDSDADFDRRQELEKMTNEQLWSLILSQHKQLPENIKNRRYLIRAIEKNQTITPVKMTPDVNTHVFAIKVEKEVLKERIRLRADSMFAGKILQETQRLLARYHQNSEAMTGNIYPIVRRLMDGELSLAEAKERFIIKDWQLAKRQITWLKRHEYVQWLDLKTTKHSVEDILQKFRDA